MEKISGNYNQIKEKILNDYQNNDNSICDYFASTICTDLSIEEVTKLYAELRYKCDGDITCNIIDKDNVMLLAEDKIAPLAEVIKLVKE